MNRDELLALADRVEALNGYDKNVALSVASALECDIFDDWDFTDGIADIAWILENHGFAWFKLRTSDGSPWFEVEKKAGADCCYISRRASTTANALLAAALRALAVHGVLSDDDKSALAHQSTAAQAGEGE